MLIVELKKLQVNGIDTRIEPYNSYTNKILKLVQIVMNKQAMQEFIINYRCQYRNGFSQTTLDNAQIFNAFYSGQERGGENDGIWQAEINYYYAKTSTVGYTNVGSTLINTNTRLIPLAYDNESLADRVGNLVHEYCHLVGMDHSGPYSFWKKKERLYSAPYAIGHAAQSIAKAHLGMGSEVWNAL